MSSSVYCHVLGSAAANPAAPEILASWRGQFSKFPNLDYRIAVLGFMRDGPSGSSRWLTDEEICQGVARALATGGPVIIRGRRGALGGEALKPPRFLFAVGQNQSLASRCIRLEVSQRLPPRA